MPRSKTVNVTEKLIDEPESSGTKRRPGKEINVSEVGDAGLIKKKHKVNIKEAVVTNNVLNLKKNRADYPTISCRMSPSAFSYAMERLNEVQRQQVIELGFGILLRMKHKDVPPKMLYWLIDNFNPRGCAIELAKGFIVKVTEYDVHLMLGLPMGEQLITKKQRLAKCMVYEAWKKEFTGISDDNIRGKMVADKMLSYETGGTWFKRHFIVLMSHCLVQGTANGALKPQFMHHLENPDNAKNLKWCDFILRSLVDRSLVWKKSKKSNFSGPSLFISLLYADRVVNGYRDIDRSFPGFISLYDWLPERQELEIKCGGFGEGFIALPYNPNAEHNDVPQVPLVHQQSPTNANELVDNNVEEIHDDVEQMHDDNTGIEDMNHDVHNVVGPHANTTNTLLEIGKKIINEGMNIADSVAKIKAWVEAVPAELQSNPIFMKTVGASLMVATQSTNDVSSQSQATQEDSEFWGCPETMAELAKMTDKVVAVHSFIKDFRAPSFSLGMTQDWEVVRNVVEEIDNDHQIDQLSTTDYVKHLANTGFQHLEDLNTIVHHHEISKNVDDQVEHYEAGTHKTLNVRDIVNEEGGAKSDKGKSYKSIEGDSARQQVEGHINAPSDKGKQKLDGGNVHDDAFLIKYKRAKKWKVKMTNQ